MNNLKVTRKRKSNFDKFFLLSWKKIYVLVVGGFVSIMLHNLWYAIFGFEDAVFLLIVVIGVPVYFLTLVIYTVIKKLRRKRK